MKENAHPLSDKDACLSMIDPSDLKGSVQIERGQLACRLVDTDSNILKALRAQLSKQLQLQRAVFEDDLRSYWQYRFPDADDSEGGSNIIDGLGLLRLIALSGQYAGRTSKRIAPFQINTLAVRAGMDRLLVPTILQQTLARCSTCGRQMHRVHMPEVSKLLGAHQTFLIAGQASAPSNSAMNVGHLVEMTQVERVVVGERLMTVEQLSADVDFSLADRVADFGPKYPSLFLVLDSLTLRKDSDPQSNLDSAILAAEKRWGKPVWLFKSGGRESISDRVVASEGQFCENCHSFLKPLTVQDLNLDEGALACRICHGDGRLTDNSVCDQCRGVGLVAEWSRGTIFGIELGQLSHLTVAELKPKIADTGSSSASPTQLLYNLNLLIELGFADYKLDHSGENWSTGEAVRWQIFDQVACDINDSSIVLDFVLDVFESSELKNIIKPIRNLAAAGNSVLVISARDDIARECDSSFSAFKQGDIGQRVKESDPQRAIKLKNVQIAPWAGQQLTLPVGGLFCLSGPSGSGKTILLRDILADLFRRGSPKLSMLDSDSQASQKDFGFFEYLDFCNQAELSSDNLAALAGLDELLANHFSHSKEARLKGALRKDFLLSRSRAGRPKEDVLKVEWSGLEYGAVFDLTWVELRERFLFDDEIRAATSAFCNMGLGGVSCGRLFGSLSYLEKLRALFAQAFAKRKIQVDAQPGVFFGLDYPFLAHSPDLVLESLKFLRERADKGQTIYCVSNDMAFFGRFDHVLQASCGNGIRQIV